MPMIRHVTVFGIAAAIALAHTQAFAAPPTKEECIDSHSKGQDLRDSGHLADAKRLFLICGQQTCPALVQSDCAKYGEELGRTVPSVSFSARDGKGGDLPDTQVFVDDKLVATRLDEGKAFDIDPGKHTVKFVRSGAEPVLVTLVATVGERGRNITATFGGDKAVSTTDPSGTPKPLTSTTTTTTPSTADKSGGDRSVVPLVVAGVGFAAGLTGLVLGLVGVSGVPDTCDSGSNTCKAPPGDPAFDDASSSMSLANIGLALGIGGAAVGIGGLVWYFLSSPHERAIPTGTAATAAKFAPALRSSRAGLQLSF